MQFKMPKERHTNSFELAANLANRKGSKQHEKSDKMRNWLEFLEVWQDIKSGN